jgi:hypothetical protein
VRDWEIWQQLVVRRDLFGISCQWRRSPKYTVSAETPGCKTSRKDQLGNRSSRRVGKADAASRRSPTVLELIGCPAWSDCETVRRRGLTLLGVLVQHDIRISFCPKHFRCGWSFGLCDWKVPCRAVFRHFSGIRMRVHAPRL